ncbi:helix-turn-helix domain-containing protein [Microtetraspora fusca]|uniref:helix-turn-helix domain-containing protein n=1 Tax=Microtetraspora fusca TaxID=1997 RepID=UPI00082EBB57
MLTTEGAARREQGRMQAGDRFTQGVTDAQVAAEFRVSRMSLSRWHEAFEWRPPRRAAILT